MTGVQTCALPISSEVREALSSGESGDARPRGGSSILAAAAGGRHKVGGGGTAGISRAPEVGSSHPRTLTLSTPLCSFSLSPLGSCECAVAAHKCLSAGSGRSGKVAPRELLRCGPSRGHPQGTLPVAVVLPGLSTPSPAL